jgi:hypothetical protein
MNEKTATKYAGAIRRTKEERILCSAIWYIELEGKEKDIPKEQYLPVNCPTGIVFCGHRHLQCMRTMNHVFGLSDHEAGKSVQGFLTNWNRFVDRKEGGEIAFKAGQTDNLIGHLFSEDLWMEY